jgi:hydrogenase/urease accessory protein HupE
VVRSVIIIVLIAVVSIPALAHEARPAYLELQQTENDTYDMTWKVPAKGPDMRLGLHVRLPEDCKIVTPVQTSYVAGAFLERSSIRRAGGITGAEIYIEGLSSTLTDVLVRIARLDGTTQVARLTPSSPAFVVESSPTFLGVAKTYLILGFQHIWEGIDHLLFVACLMFIARTWRRILVTITGFTVAHSITLALAALEVVRVPAPPVEAMIALSIVFLAVEIAREQRETLTWRYPVTVSGSFGLLHGFGFASALGTIGLPQIEIPAALFFFNVGVEVGQILFVATLLVLVGGVYALAKKNADGTDNRLIVLQKPIAYTVGTVAMFWTAERVVSFWS